MTAYLAALHWSDLPGFYPAIPVAPPPQPLPSVTDMCNYCADAQEPPAVFLSHSMFSRSTGAPECPRFRRDGCPRCGARGDRAHVPSKCRKVRKSPRQYICLLQMQERHPLRLVVLKKLRRRHSGRHAPVPMPAPGPARANAPMPRYAPAASTDDAIIIN